MQASAASIDSATVPERFHPERAVDDERGGYYHVYYPMDPTRIANEMQRMLNDWYAKMGQYIQKFEDKYERADAGVEIPAQS